MSARPAIGADGRRRRIASVAGLALGQAASAGVVAFATREAFGALHAAGPAPAGALLAIALGGAAIAALRVAERAVAERVGCDYAAALRERLFLHAARTPPSAMAGRSRGVLALRFVGDLAAVRGWVSKGLARLISAAVTLPASLLVLFLLDWRIAVAATPALLASLAGLAALGRPLGSAHRLLRRSRARLASDATERVAHGAALRLVGRVSAERARLASRAQRLADHATDRARLAEAARAIPDAAAGLAAAAMLGTAFWTGVSPATAAGALAALGLSIQPLRRLADVRDRHEAWRVAAARIDAALAAPTLPARDHARASPDPQASALSLEDVRVDGGPPVTGGVARGEIVVLSPGGADGAALLLAAAGIEERYAGRIRAFGHPPSALPTGTISYVGPSAPVMRGTLRKNLTLGCRGRIDDAALARAVGLCELDAVVERLGGLEGRIAEGGRNLSASERARLLLARALLGEGHLVLVDAVELAIPERLLAVLVAALRARGAAALLLAPPLLDGDVADRRWTALDAPGGARGAPGARGAAREREGRPRCA